MAGWSKPSLEPSETMKAYTFTVEAAVTVSTDGGEAEARRLLAAGCLDDDVFIGPCSTYLPSSSLDRAELVDVHDLGDD